jgi:hypothetical protein
MNCHGTDRMVQNAEVKLKGLRHLIQAAKDGAAGPHPCTRDEDTLQWLLDIIDNVQPWETEYCDCHAGRRTNYAICNECDVYGSKWEPDPPEEELENAHTPHLEGGVSL